MRLLLFSVIFLSACTEYSIDEYSDATKQCAQIKMIAIDSHRGKLCCSDPQVYSCLAFPKNKDAEK